MDPALENIVANLLVPDNRVIAEATEELKKYLKKPNVVVSLFELFASEKPEVRQYAAILLRRKILKQETWEEISSEVRVGIKGNLLAVFTKETLAPAKKSMLHLISTIASHDLSEGLWPELFAFVEQLVTNSDDKQIETGMSVLNCVTSACGADLDSHLESFLSICHSALQHTNNHMIPYYAILILTNILELVEASKESQETYKSFILPTIEIIKRIATVDQTQASECLAMYEDMIAMEASFLTPHLQALLTFLIQAGKDASLENVFRVKCLDLICDIIEKNKKMIVRKNLMKGLMEEIYSIMCQKYEGDEEDFEESAVAFAAHVLYKMSLNLPPEKFLFTLTKLFESTYTSELACMRAAAFIAIGVCTEGCSETIKSKEMKMYLKHVYAGMNDPDQEVRSACMYTLGEFSNFLQPNISKFSKDLIPLLFDCLSKSNFENETSMKHVSRTYFALERFCENLGKDIVPYLNVLMDFFLASIQKSGSHKIKEHSISALGAFAMSAEEEILPYLESILNVLKPFLQETTDEDGLKLQVKTIETLSMLVEGLKDEHPSLARESLQLTMALLATAADPDLKTSIFGMFGSCSVVLKEEFASFLPSIAPILITAIRSTEGIIENYEDEEIKKVSELFDDVEKEDGSRNGPVNAISLLTSIQLQNSYLFEKGAALEAVGLIATNVGASFSPYFEQSYTEVMDLIGFPETDIRKEAVETASKLCVSVQKTPDAHAKKEWYEKLLKETLEVFFKMARHDEEREVVTTVFEAINLITKEIPVIPLASINSVDVYFDLITDCIKYKLKCQEASVEDEDDEEEYDALLIETAGDLIPCLATVSPTEKFNSFLQTTMPIFLKKHKSSKVCDRSFAVGALAETVKEMAGQGWQFGSQIYPIMMSSLTDEDEEVRSNAAFGLGTLALSGNTTIHSHYEEMLKALSRMMSKETDALVLDNITAALARMIISNAAIMPLGEVLPPILARFPLEEDKEENSTILQCIHLLVSQKNSDVIVLLPRILPSIGNLLNTKLTPEQKSAAVSLVREVYASHSEAFQVIPQDQTKAIENLKKCLN